MANARENSQQDRRVYVGNLSYDVKWHHLKDFMRQGEPALPLINISLRWGGVEDDANEIGKQLAKCSTLMCYYFRME
jgi:RNA recognition motif-containing protein